MPKVLLWNSACFLVIRIRFIVLAVKAEGILTGAESFCGAENSRCGCLHLFELRKTEFPISFNLM
jgi:hypothetical protein